MANLKDSIVTWFIKNLLIPQREIIDKPGYLINRVTGGKGIELRDILIPEEMLIEIEDNITKKYGKEGIQRLYSAGKKFGYYYASISDFKTTKNTDKKELSLFVSFFADYLGSTYSSALTYNFNIQKKMLHLKAKDYIVCRKNGLGYLLGAGGGAGTWSWIMQDEKIEGIQIYCVGKGNDICEFIFGPFREIKKYGGVFKEHELIMGKYGDYYKTTNKLRKNTYSTASLKSYIDAGFFDYERGIISHKNERYIPLDPILLNIIVEEVNKIAKNKEIFEISKEVGRKNKINEINSICDFLSACGWGDPLFIKKEYPTFYFFHFPWNPKMKLGSLDIFVGYLTGLLENIMDIKLKDYDYELNSGDPVLRVRWS